VLQPIVAGVNSSEIQGAAIFLASACLENLLW